MGRRSLPQAQKQGCSKIRYEQTIPKRHLCLDVLQTHRGLIALHHHRYVRFTGDYVRFGHNRGFGPYRNDSANIFKDRYRRANTSHP